MNWLPPPVYYMPHRPVVKESSLATKVRPVFDTSAKGYNGVSLNDCLETGPSLLPDLPGILIRFRRWKVALSADVSKAFLQIQVCQQDQDVHRFLWNDKGVVRVMKFVRLPLSGNKSSPFLLNAVVKHHLANYSPSQLVHELQQNLYVDDWLSGGDDDVEAEERFRGALEIMGQAGLRLIKWGSNSDWVKGIACQEYNDRYVGEKSFKVLGMRWVLHEDCFRFDGWQAHIVTSA